MRSYSIMLHIISLTSSQPLLSVDVGTDVQLQLVEESFYTACKSVCRDNCAVENILGYITH
jgi:hypothetical protein